MVATEEVDKSAPSTRSPIGRSLRSGSIKIQWSPTRDRHRWWICAMNRQRGTQTQAILSSKKIYASPTKRSAYGYKDAANSKDRLQVSNKGTSSLLMRSCSPWKRHTITGSGQRHQNHSRLWSREEFVPAARPPSFSGIKGWKSIRKCTTAIFSRMWKTILGLVELAGSDGLQCVVSFGGQGLS